MTDIDPHTLETDLDQLYQRIVDAEQQINSGVTVDLADVPAQVEDICRVLLNMPPAQSLAAVPRLEKMIADLDALGIKIKQLDN